MADKNTKSVRVQLPDNSWVDVQGLPSDWTREDVRKNLVHTGNLRPPLATTDFMLGGAEIALNFASFFPTMAASGVFGAMYSGYKTDIFEYGKGFQTSVDALTEMGLYWQPRSDSGKFMMGKFEDFLHFFQKGDRFGEFFYDKQFDDKQEFARNSGLNSVATLAKTVGDGWPLIIPFLGMKGPLGQASTKIAEKNISAMGAAIRDAERTSGITVGKVPEKGVPLKEGALPEVTGEVIVPTVVGRPLTRTLQTPGFHPDKFTVEMIDLITEASKVIAKEKRLPEGHPLADARIFRQLGQLIRDGELNGVRAIEFMRKKYNLSLEETAAVFEYTASFSGQVLNRMRQLRDVIRKETNDPIVATAFERFLRNTEKEGVTLNFEEAVLENVLRKHGKLTNTWKMFLTSSPTTTVRNVLTSTAYLGIDGVERLIASTAMAAGRSIKQRELKPFMEEFGALANSTKAFAKLPFAKREKLQEILLNSNTIYQDLLYKGRDIAKQPADATTFLGRAKQRVKDTIVYPSSRMSEVYGDMYIPRTSGFVHILNSTAERSILEVSFEMQLRHDLALMGKNFDTLSAKEAAKLPNVVLERAWDHATTITFSRTPKAEWLQKVIRGIGATPLVAQTIPFPRFWLGNAVPFVMRHGPWQGLRLLSRQQRKYLLENPREMAKMAAEMTVGSYLMAEGFSSAWNSPPGQKWNEERVTINPDDPTDTSFLKRMVEKGMSITGVGPGEYDIDSTPFSPLAYYKGLAIMFIAPESLSPADAAAILSGLNRVQGTGLGLLDIFRQKGQTKADVAFDLFKRTIGNFAGGFAMPTRVIKDVMSGWEPEEAIYRDLRQNPVLGPFFNNVPWLSRELPPKFSPLYEGKRVNRWQRYKQITGLTIKEKNEIEREVERLGLPYRSVFASTGNSVYDNTINKYMGEVFKDVYLEHVVRNPQYKKLSPKAQTLVWQLGILPEVRKQSHLKMASIQPKLFAQYYIEDRVPQNIKDLLKDVGVDFDEALMKKMLEIGGPETSEAESQLFRSNAPR